MSETVSYGTWIRDGRLAGFALALASSLLLGLGLGLFVHPGFLALLLPAPGLAYIVLVLGLTRYRFSPAGGGLQEAVHRLIAARVEAGERILDIGCGGGSLAIMLAKRFPAASVRGVDYWGTEWEYSLGQCEKNARLEGVANIVFTKGTASALSFAAATMDAVVSCLTFHEVGDVEAKEDCVAEALRVLAPGGRFVFVDLFDDRSHYPDPHALERTIAAAGSSIDENRPLRELLDLPFPLGGAKVLGRARLIAGFK
jgi:SAM-dependent methyltransferase